MSEEVIIVYEKHIGLDVEKFYIAEVDSNEPFNGAEVYTEDGIVNLDGEDYGFASAGQVFEHFTEKNQELENRINELERMVEHITENVDLPTLI